MKLSFINDIKKSNITCSKFNGTKTYIDTGDVDKLVVSLGKDYTYNEKPSRANICVEIGDVLFAKMKNSIKVIEIDDSNVDKIYSTGFYCFRDDRILPSFLKYLFLSEKFNFHKDIKSVGATMKAINDTGMSSISVIIPEISIQMRHVSELDMLLTIINDLNVRLELYDEFIKSKFYELFGDIENNTKSWETKLMSQLGIFKNGLNYGSAESGKNINLLGVGDFGKKFEIIDTSLLPSIYLNEMPSNDYILENEDIVFVRSNGNKELVGRSLIVYPNDVVTTFSGFCIRFRKTENKLKAIFLLYILKNDSTRRKMFGKGANINNLNQTILGNLKIPVPPLEIQEDFIKYVKFVDSEKTNLLNRIDVYTMLLNKKMNDIYILEVS